MYVRNGGEPALAESMRDDAAPAYHWVRLPLSRGASTLSRRQELTFIRTQFDGDGMLTGVYFQEARTATGRRRLVPTFVNRYVLTDVYLASHALGLKTPILPSIATLVGSIWTLPLILLSIFRAVFLAFLSFFTHSPLRHLSVANTSILWHDGRALASCESGPLTWVTLPALDTVGYWSLEGDGGEPGLREGMIGWMKEWTTAHVRPPSRASLLSRRRRN